MLFIQVFVAVKCAMRSVQSVLVGEVTNAVYIQTVHRIARSICAKSMNCEEFYRNVEDKKMNRFRVPVMDIQRFNAEDIIATSGCSVEALNCADDCYCVGVICNPYCGSQTCNEECYTDVD